MSPLNYVKALISPAGRLDPVSFAFLSIVLAVGHLYVFAQISYSNLGLTWNVYTISLFAMLWMQFCILTRRSRDTGSSGAAYVPFFLLAVAMFLLALDPEGIWPDIEESGMGSYVTEYGVKFLRALYVALFLYGVRAPGMDGENAYGPEFGDLTDDEARKKADKRHQAERRAGPDRRRNSGPYNGVERRKGGDRRAVIPKGFSERQRPAGFGRR